MNWEENKHPRDKDGKFASKGGEKTYPKGTNKEYADKVNKKFEIIQKYNPMIDDYHTGIREPSDIKTPQEAFDINDEENFAYPDFTKEDGLKALKTGKIIVYSSKPISQGGFISPSKMMAQDYAGSGKVYSMEVDLDDIAWINSDEGQYAKTKKEETLEIDDDYERAYGEAPDKEEFPESYKKYVDDYKKWLNNKVEQEEKEKAFKMFGLPF